MKNKPKMKPINLMSAIDKIEKLVQKHTSTRDICVQFKKDDDGDYILSAVVFYKEKQKDSNFSAYVYAEYAELTIENLLLEVEQELKNYGLFKHSKMP